MYAVRIDKDGDGYVFKVHPYEGLFEMVAMDSTPGIIAIVNADDPAAACARAWHQALHMRDNDRGRLASRDMIKLFLGET